MNKKARYNKSSRLLIISLIVINLGIMLISYWYYAVEKKAFGDQKISQLKNIAEIKLNQVNDWRNERLSDARYLSVSPQVVESFHLLSSDQNNTNYQKLLFSNLNGMFLNGKYESMIAIDRSGNQFFEISANGSNIAKNKRQIALKPGSRSGQILTGDLILSKKGVATMQIVIPEFSIRGDDTTYYGWLALNINLATNFSPLLKTMPIPSKTMEVNLAFFNPGSSSPLSNNGKVTENGDLLSVIYPIPGSKVMLVVSVHKSEDFAEIRKLRFSMIAFTGMMMLAFTSSFSFFWLRQKNELLILETEKRMILERFDMLSKFANDAIIVYANDMTILQVNDKALELYGYTREELLGMSADLLSSPEIRDKLPVLLETTIQDGGYRFDTLQIRKDGTEFPVEVSLRYMELMGSQCFQAVVRDITQRKQFEKALITSEERLRLITNTVPQIVWTAKPDGSFDFVNSRFEVLTGLYPLKENSINGFIHANDQERVVSYWKMAVNEIREHHIRFRLRIKDGSYRWFLCIAIPLCNAEGQVMRWYGSATDINELENNVAQRTAELSDLYNNAPCGYHSLDINGTFVKINDTALRWLGYAREEIIELRSFADLITAKSRVAFNKDFLILKTRGNVNNLEYDMVRKDGTLLPVLLSATAVKDKDGKFLGTRTTIMDHTEGKRHEDEILKLNTILQEHGYNLEYINKELEAFIFSVSHDLRAPLRAINGFSKILLDDYRDKLDNEGQNLLFKVWENANRMRQLIDDLLRLSRTGRQELSYAKIDMEALFISLIEEARQQFPDRKVNVEVNQLPKAIGDLALLKQVISNLLSNAVKFSGKKDTSEIEIGAVSGEGEEIFYVKDNGTGFDMKYVDELFAVFRRLNNAEDYEGTGVGLALVKRIIDKHGGRVWAVSEPDKGAIFYFSLPSNNVA